MTQHLTLHIRREWLWAAMVAAVLLLLWLVYASHETIPAGHVGVSGPLKPGKAPTLLDPGLHAKWPWRRVREVDVRTRSADLTDRERRTGDGEEVVVSGYVLWRVPEEYAATFLRAGGPAAVEGMLVQRIADAVDDELARRRLPELVSADAADTEGLSRASERVVIACAAEVVDRLGVELLDVRFDLRRPEELWPTVYRRMIADRHRRIDAGRTEATIEADRIRSEAETDARRASDEAETAVSDIRTRTERHIAEIYQNAGLEPAFRELVVTLDRYRRLMEENAALIISDDSLFNDLLKSPHRADTFSPDGGHE